jgi:hypothetical protein
MVNLQEFFRQTKKKGIDFSTPNSIVHTINLNHISS